MNSRIVVRQVDTLPPLSRGSLRSAEAFLGDLGETISELRELLERGQMPQLANLAAAGGDVALRFEPVRFNGHPGLHLRIYRNGALIFEALADRSSPGVWLLLVRRR